MKTLLIIIFSFSSFIFPANAQVIDTIYFSKSNIKEFMNYENKIGSSLFNEKETFGIPKYPFDNSSDEYEYEYKLPVTIYKRANDTFITGLYIHLIANNNKTIRYANFNWGYFNMSLSSKQEEEAAKECIGKQKEFENKYNEILNYLKGKFGEPTKVGKGYDSEFAIGRNCSWITENIKMQLIMKFQKKAFQLPKEFVQPTVDNCVYLQIFYK